MRIHRIYTRRMRQTLWYRRLGHSGITFVNVLDNFRINFIL